METPDYINAAAAGRLIGVSTTTIFNWAERGLITVYETPTGRKLFLKSEILSAVKERIKR